MHTAGRGAERAKAGEPSGLLKIVGRKYVVSSHHLVLFPSQFSEISLSHMVDPCLSPLLNQDLVARVASCSTPSSCANWKINSSQPSPFQQHSNPQPSISPGKLHEAGNWSSLLKFPSPHLTTSYQESLITNDSIVASPFTSCHHRRPSSNLKLTKLSQDPPQPMASQPVRSYSTASPMIFKKNWKLPQEDYTDIWWI